MPQPPTKADYEEFEYILNIHKFLVKHLGELFQHKDYTTHDDSKFLEPEYTPYTLRFVKKLTKEDNPQWEAAKKHHFEMNNHHIEHWKYFAKQDMPTDRLCEAVIDMMAAKFQYNLYPGVVDYVRVNHYDIDFDKLKEKLKEFLKTPEMYFFKDQFLSEYTEVQKAFINDKLSEYKKMFNNLVVRQHSDL